MATVVERSAVFLLCIGIALPIAGSALAANAAAQALFEEGRRLMTSGDYPGACAKFAESERLEPAGGTMMNLAVCHLRMHKTATAWTEFHDALTQAERDGRRERVEEARRQIAELELQISRLVIRVASPVEGQTVFLDGEALEAGSWGTRIPVDPGVHDVQSNAAGHVSWRQKAEVSASSDAEIDIPPLALEGATPTTTGPDQQPGGAAPREALRPSSGPPTAAYGLTGAAVAAIGVGAYFGVLAMNGWQGTAATCRATQVCSQKDANSARLANTLAWVSDISFGVGLATGALATILFVSPTSRTEAAPATALHLTPLIGAQSIGVGAGAEW